MDQLLGTRHFYALPQSIYDMVVEWWTLENAIFQNSKDILRRNKWVQGAQRTCKKFTLIVANYSLEKHLNSHCDELFELAK
jgi:hypothetical protein